MNTFAWVGFSDSCEVLFDQYFNLQSSYQKKKASGPSAVPFIVSYQGTVLSTLTVYDADTTPIYPFESSRRKYTGTIITDDPWISETFRVEHIFDEIHFSPNGSQVRGTRHEYSKDPFFK